MFIFDCERLKHPNIGFYSYTDNLAKALAAQARESHTDMGFFVMRADVGRYGDDMFYKVVSPLNKLYLPVSRNVKVWHCGRQRTPYIPSGDAAILMTVHDLNFLYEWEPYKHRRFLWSYQRSVDRADRIVTISEFAKRDICNHLDLKGKTIDVVHNGLNFYDGTITAPQRKPKGEFLYAIGAVWPKKNFHVLPALLKGNDYSLVISGLTSKPDYVRKIMDEAAKWGVSDRVEITGTVHEDVKHWYLANCSAFVFPSIAEGFGLPVIEAMHYGKPIFLSDHTSLPEIGGKYAFYFDHDFDRDAMRTQFAAGMDAFARGEVDVKGMIAHAESFSWRTAARKYLDIYHQMASCSGSL